MSVSPFSPTSAAASRLERLLARAELQLADPLRRPFEARWDSWFSTLFPLLAKTGFGPHHVEFWEWLWALQHGVPARPFIAIWPRGGAKSTNAELGTIAVGALRKRRYGLYISETQESADKHITNIGEFLQHDTIAEHYPLLAERDVSKYGNSKGWRRNRLYTAAGFVVDSIGLDVAIRGVKIGDQRPDFMVIDDVDAVDDTKAATEKKIRALTQSILPAGATDGSTAVLAVQNLITPDSIFSQLAGVSQLTADFLANRIVSGPFPALYDMVVERVGGRSLITGGTPLWAGQDLAACQAAMDISGETGFRRESQHEVQQPVGGIFDHLDFPSIQVTAGAIPELVRGVVCVDPAVTSTDTSDSHGIHADGIAEDGLIYRLWSVEARMTPETSLVLAIMKAVELGFTDVVVETDQGGDTWEFLYREIVRRLIDTGITVNGHAYRIPAAARPPRFNHRKAGAIGSKTHRASQMLVDYERGRFRHVIGTHVVLERALQRFPRVKPFDLTDASFWAWHFLTQGQALPYGWLRRDPEFRERMDEIHRVNAEEAAANRRQAELEARLGLNP